MTSFDEAMSRRNIAVMAASFLAQALVAPAAAQLAKTADDQFALLISDFGRLRSLAYAQVLDLKALYKNSKPDIARSGTAYRKAKQAADSWLDIARSGVAIKRSRPDAKALKAASDQLQKLTNDLVELAQKARAAKSPNEATKNPALIAAVAGLVVSLVEVGIKVYESWDKADDKERTQIREELERLRWVPFSDI